MSPAEYAAAVDALGWSGRHVAGMLGCHRNLPPAWEDGRLTVPPAVAQWIGQIVQVIQKYPPPAQWRTRSAA